MPTTVKVELGDQSFEVMFPGETGRAEIKAAMKAKFGELLEVGKQIYGDMTPMSRAAVWTMPVPIAGDITGLLADAEMYIEDPESRTLFNGLLTVVGMVPYVPAASQVRSAVKSLDMSKAARMERARELGFDTDTVYYHGTPDSIIGGGFSREHLNSPEGVYFGATPRTAEAYLDEIPSIKPEKFKQKFGVSMEEWSAEVGKRKAALVEQGYDMEDIVKQLDYPDDIQHEIRVVSNAERKLNPYFYNSPEFPESEWIDHEKVGEVIEAHIPRNMMEYEMGGAAWDEPTQKRIAKEAAEQGYDGVLFKDMQDSGWFGGSGVDDIALVFDPKNIRSVNAAFDPAKKDSAKLLAEIVGAGVLTGTVAHERGKRKDLEGVVE